MRAKASEIVNKIFSLVQDGEINVDDVIEMSNERSEILVKWGDDLTSTNYVKSENNQESIKSNNKPIKIKISCEIDIENTDLLEFNIISNSVKKPKDNYKTETNDI